MIRTITAIALSVSLAAICLASPAGQSTQNGSTGGAAKLSTVVHVGGEIATTFLIRHVAPVYPPLAKEAHVQGTVKLQVVVAKDGSVESMQVISGQPLLLKAAMDAVKQWQYKPYLLDGVPVEFDTNVEVNFILGRPPAPAAGSENSGASTPSAVPNSFHPGYVWPTRAAQAAELKAEQEAAAKVDPQTAADIRDLLDATRVRQRIAQVVEVLGPRLARLAFAHSPLPVSQRLAMTNIMTQEMVQRVQADQSLYDVEIPVYAKHFSDSEIRAVLAFYESPAGKKFVAEQQTMAPEIMAAFMPHWKLIVMPNLMTEFVRRASRLNAGEPSSPAGTLIPK